MLRRNGRTPKCASFQENCDAVAKQLPEQMATPFSPFTWHYFTALGRRHFAGDFNLGSRAPAFQRFLSLSEKRICEESLAFALTSGEKFHPNRVIRQVRLG